MWRIEIRSESATWVYCATARLCLDRGVAEDSLTAAPPVRVVAYVRVSRERPDMVSPELQLAAIRQQCERSGYRLVSVIEDLDLSGRFWKRRQVDRAIGLIEARQAEVLMVWKWFRVARNRLDWAVALDRVESAGGRLESATEAIDAGSAAGRLARGLLAAFAAFEAERSSDMWKEALERRVRHDLPGDGRTRFGYRYVDVRYEIDPDTGPLLAELYRRRIAGDGVGVLENWLTGIGVRRPRPISEPVERFWPSTVASILNTGFGAGLLSWHGEHRLGAQPAVITGAQWAAYRRITPSRPGPRPNRSTRPASS